MGGGVVEAPCAVRACFRDSAETRVLSVLGSQPSRGADSSAVDEWLGALAPPPAPLPLSVDLNYHRPPMLCAVHTAQPVRCRCPLLHLHLLRACSAKQKMAGQSGTMRP